MSKMCSIILCKMEIPYILELKMPEVLMGHQKPFDLLCVILLFIFCSNDVIPLTHSFRKQLLSTSVHLNE